MKRVAFSSALFQFFLVALTGCGHRRTPSVYEIPERFRGWVLIQFKQPGCKPLIKVQGKFVFRISPDGKLCTSSEPEFGWASDEYYFVSADQRTAIPVTTWGRGGLIWNQTNGECSLTGRPVATFANFYVGTEQDAKNASSQPTPRECDTYNGPNELRIRVRRGSR